jgi:hypothetical protein
VESFSIEQSCGQYTNGLRQSFAEVLYYFRLQVSPDRTHTVAVIAPYGSPDEFLLAESSNTLYSCEMEDSITVINVKQIESVVAMLPHQVDGADRFFLLEKPGLDVWDMGEFMEEHENEADHDDIDTEM